MIIKGGAGGNIGFWAKHLLRDDTNDSVRLVETAGVLATDLPSALKEMQAIAAQSRSRGNFLYQANINPAPGDELTPGQWREAVDLMEEKLKFKGHQRVVVEHVKGGRRHFHVIWNRVNSDTLKVVDITNNFKAHTDAARELEKRFGLQATTETRGRGERPERLWEQRAAERSGIDRNEVADDVTRLWHGTKTGREFQAALEGEGYLLARGDKRDFCIVDPAGDVHSLARRLRGVSTQEVRERLVDIDRDRLPSVADARLRQRGWDDGNRPKGSPTATSSNLKLAARAATVRARRITPQQGASSSTASVRSLFSRVGRSAARPVINFKAASMALATRIQSSRASVGDGAASASNRTVPRSTMASPTAENELGPVSDTATALGSVDLTVYGRAAAAYADEFSRWQNGIDALHSDLSLTPDQRSAAIKAMQTRGKMAADGIRRRIIEEEMQRARHARRTARRPARPRSPKPPTMPRPR